MVLHDLGLRMGTLSWRVSHAGSRHQAQLAVPLWLAFGFELHPLAGGRVEPSGGKVIDHVHTSVSNHRLTPQGFLGWSPLQPSKEPLGAEHQWTLPSELRLVTRCPSDIHSQEHLLFLRCVILRFQLLQSLLIFSPGNQDMGLQCLPLRTQPHGWAALSSSIILTRFSSWALSFSLSVSLTE